MTESMQDELDLASDEVFSPDLEGFEGPLHLLLALARTGKIDLKPLSMTALADQYLEFIAAAQLRRLEVAADYLVMAAWLAQLKSRLLFSRAKASRISCPVCASKWARSRRSTRARKR